MTASATRGGEHGYGKGELVVGLEDGCCLVAGNVKGMAVFGPGEAAEAVIDATHGECGFVARYRSGGELAWARKLPGRVDIERGAALAVSRHGGFMVVGDFRDAPPAGDPRRPRQRTRKAAASRGPFVASYQDDGAMAWVRTASGDGAVGGQSAAILQDGSHVVTGWLMGRVEFEAGAGRRAVRARGLMDLFVAALESSGRLRWLHRIGGKGEAYAQGLLVSEQADRTVEVAGTFGGKIEFVEAGHARASLEAECVDDALVVRFDSAGRLLWLRRGSHDR